MQKWRGMVDGVGRKLHGKAAAGAEGNAARRRFTASRVDCFYGEGEEVVAELGVVSIWLGVAPIAGEVRCPARLRLGLGGRKGEGKRRGGGSRGAEERLEGDLMPRGRGGGARAVDAWGEGTAGGARRSLAAWSGASWGTARGTGHGRGGEGSRAERCAAERRGGGAWAVRRGSEEHGGVPCGHWSYRKRMMTLQRAPWTSFPIYL